MGKVRTNNIFDYLKTDPENIDEKTVYENTGVNKENVREILMKKINDNATAAPKKNKKKTITISLIAAAAAITVLGTTAAATGTFNSTFGQLFAGEMKGNMYAGGNVKAESEKLNIDFQGIAGDKNEVYGMMTITNKDGSAFVEDTDNYFISASYDDPDITCTLSLWDQMASKLWYYGQEMTGGGVEYELQDKNTIQATIQYSSDGYNIIGETLSLKEHNINLYHVDTVLCTADEITAYWESIDNDTEVHSDETITTKTAMEYVDELADNQTFRFTPNGDWVIATVTPFELEYDLSVKLNYKDTSRSFPEAKGIKTTYHNAEMTVKNLEAQAFQLKLDLLYPTDDLEEINKINRNFDDSINTVTVTMKDGTVYQATEGGIYASDNMQRIAFHFYSDDYRIIVIDPQDIVSIVYNGTTLYQE